jgi:hypothetical protein
MTKFMIFLIIYSIVYPILTTKQVLKSMKSIERRVIIDNITNNTVSFISKLVDNNKVKKQIFKFNKEYEEEEPSYKSIAAAKQYNEIDFDLERIPLHNIDKSTTNGSKNTSQNSLPVQKHA